MWDLKRRRFLPQPEKRRRQMRGHPSLVLCVWHFHNISETFPERVCHQLLSHLSVRPVSLSVCSHRRTPSSPSPSLTPPTRWSVFLFSDRLAVSSRCLTVRPSVLREEAICRSVSLRPAREPLSSPGSAGLSGCNDYKDYNLVQIERLLLLHTMQCTIVYVLSSE